MRECSVCGKECEKGKFIKGMCQRHYTQVMKYGKPLDYNKESYRDLNEIIEYDDYAEIILCDVYRNEVARAKIDLEDVEKVKDYNWCYHINTYANSNKAGLLHRLIMDCQDGMVVDHIGGHGTELDNRKINLRVCTHRENMMNAKVQKNNKSGVTGVTFERNKWVARIMVDGKGIRLGTFDNKEDAIKVRKDAEEKYFGEFTKQ